MINHRFDGAGNANRIVQVERLTPECAAFFRLCRHQHRAAGHIEVLFDIKRRIPFIAAVRGNEAAGHCDGPCVDARASRQFAAADRQIAHIHIAIGRMLVQNLKFAAGQHHLAIARTF